MTVAPPFLQRQPPGEPMAEPSWDKAPEHGQMGNMGSGLISLDVSNEMELS